LLKGLQQLGWTEGHNLQLDTRWDAADPANARKYAAEFAASKPDVIVATGANAVAPLLQATRTEPIVFMNVADPVGAGSGLALARRSDERARDLSQFPGGRHSRPGTGSIRRRASPCYKISIPDSSV
jgi:ABC transporter substrate binding protein